MARVKWIDPRRATADKIDELNRNDRLVEQWARQAELDKAEIDSLYESLGVSRRFQRNLGLGNTASTYTNWQHYKAFAGYSIWKYPVSGYQHDDSNRLWIEVVDWSVHGIVPEMLEYQGVAASEGAEYFDTIYIYDGSSYSSNYAGASGELSSEGGTPVTLLEDIDDVLYVGRSSSTFEGIMFEFHRYGAGHSLVFEYWNGTDWTQLTGQNNALDDHTSNWTSDGRVEWSAPTDWSTTDVNGTTAYWIRIRTTSAPSQSAQAYRVVTDTAVESLLRLSWSEVKAQNWSWCYYSGNVYVTIPNAGPVGREGKGYITASSSDSTKRAFFTVTHAYKISHVRDSWPEAVSGRRGSSNFNGSTGTTITHNLGHTNYQVEIELTADPGSSYSYHWVSKSSDSFTVYTQDGVTSSFDWAVVVL